MKLTSNTLHRQGHLFSHLARRSISAATLLALGLLAPVALQAATTYTITDLGTLSTNAKDTTTSFGLGINDSGQAVGYSGVSGAFFYNKKLPLIPIVGLPGNYSTLSTAFGINAGGTIVGVSEPTSPLTQYSSQHAFMYSGGLSSDLGTLAGDLYYTEGYQSASSYAYAINASGRIAGYSSGVNADGSSLTQACLFFGGLITPLGSLGGSDSYAFGINTHIEIVGYSQLPQTTSPPYVTPTHAFAWSNSTQKMTDLGTLPGGVNSYAFAVNDSGQIVGTSTTAATGDTNLTHAFLLTGTAMKDLGTLGGATSEAVALNNNGDVVGHSTLSSGIEHAFLYTGGKMVDVNSLKITGTNPFAKLITATGINATGAIVGSGILPTGVQHAYVLTPKTSTAIETPLP